MASRTKNTYLNIALGYIAQFGILILSFVGRKIFLHFLSTEYLGINGLYSNILSILSFAELGLDSAVVFALYKPVADGDVKLASSLVRYFKKIYFILGGAILTIGLSIIPLLPHIINSDLLIKDLVLYYLLFLINVIVSYFTAHKIAVLSAYQEYRVHRIITLIINLLLQVAHIVILLIFKNYYAYVITSVVSTLLTNVCISVICSKRHKALFLCRETVCFDKKIINKNITSSFLYRIGNAAINSTDNILISALVSTAAVGLYSNYYTIIYAAQGFIAVITSSMINGIGNLAATGDVRKQKQLFKMLILFYSIIGTIGFVGFTFLFNSVIVLWVGPSYTFSSEIVAIIALNFFISTIFTPVWMFTEANGYFQKTKYILLIRAAINLVLSIILGKVQGVFGIFLATTISFCLTSLWYEPYILFKYVFKESVTVLFCFKGKYCFKKMINIIGFQFGIHKEDLLYFNTLKF